MVVRLLLDLEAGYDISQGSLPILENHLCTEQTGYDIQNSLSKTCKNSISKGYI